MFEDEKIDAESLQLRPPVGPGQDAGAEIGPAVFFRTRLFRREILDMGGDQPRLVALDQRTDIGAAAGERGKISLPAERRIAGADEEMV